MHKREFVERVAARCGLTKRASEQAADAVFAALADLMAEGDHLRVPGLGVFDTVRRAPRTARNPRTGETIRVDAVTLPVFRPAVPLKARLNPGSGRGRR